MKIGYNYDNKFFYISNIFDSSEISIIISTIANGDMKDILLRKKLLTVIQKDDSRLLLLNQTHSNNIVEIDNYAENSPDYFDNSDGIISYKPNDSSIPGNRLKLYESINLGIFNADCMSIFVLDPKDRFRSAFHCGRLGIENKIIEKNIIKLQNRNFSLQDSYVFIMPHICKKCYPVDLENQAKKQISNYGIKTIFTIDICTFENKNIFFSYRRDKSPQRQLSLVGNFNI